MRPIATFPVVPRLPARLARLHDLAYNLRWSWNHDTVELFRRLDSELWESSGHNPVLLLGRVDQARLEEVAADDGFLGHLDSAARSLDLYMASETTWFRRTQVPQDGALTAYFSAEFGVTECMAFFAGGLGILAGDHLKSASDLGVPLVGVGLAYRQGYFQQQLTSAGWQREEYHDNDFHTLPLVLETRGNGDPLLVEVSYPHRPVFAQVWRAQVGRVPLYLLDANLEMNRPEDRLITGQLYGGDLELRIQQEILLGVGGYRALVALGLEPSVYHMNEGHSAFLALEYVRHLMERHRLRFDAAQVAAAAGLVFTTHTPVAAGHDHFPPELVEQYLGDYARMLGLPMGELVALGQASPGEPFSMTVLALRLAAHRNGVSRLHGAVTRAMWYALWPDVPVNEVPIGHVTNGVHLESWISREMKEVYDRYLGPDWREKPADTALWARAGQIPMDELWRTHERRRERLVAFARRRLRAQRERHEPARAADTQSEGVLDARALTIGFARRFATYKRAALLFRDADRLARLLNDPERPVQILFAGKAHPRDEPGKALIQQVEQFAREPRFRQRIVFLEDYDPAVARAMVQGVDVWLNTPRRPLEASGTSGQKAAANGVLNLSVLDGWWEEAWEDTRPLGGSGGWAIGHGEDYPDPEEQDRIEAEALYALLEEEVVPAFYQRAAGGLPRAWIQRMQASITRLCATYNTHRMVREYTERFYLPAAAHAALLLAGRASQARHLADWTTRLREGWSAVKVTAVSSTPSAVTVGDELRVSAEVQLGELKPDDVAVELYLGRVNAAGELTEAAAFPMQPTRTIADGVYLFDGTGAPCPRSGLHGFSVRVLPHSPLLLTPYLPGLITWAAPNTLSHGPALVVMSSATS